METYQPQPLDVLVVPQILSEVVVIHEFKNESKWVIPGGIDPNE